jgi:DNA-binding PadR family transcriptional regulator
MKMEHNSPLPLHPENQRSDHILHLYTSNIDKYAIQRAFLALMKDDESAIIVSSDDPETIRQEFNSVDAEIKILKPEEMGSLEAEVDEDRRTRLIIDASSFPGQGETEIEAREQYINDISRKHPLSCLCTYGVNELSSSMIKQLTTFHSQLQLTTSDLTLISGDSIDRSMISDDSIKKMVKDNLEAIILALIQRKAMCGSDIIGTIHIEFNVLLSPGTVYPMLHSLQKRGLLTFVKEGKEKIYTSAEDSEPEIRRLVHEHIQARKLLNSYLQKELGVNEGEPTVEALQQVLKQKTR